MQVTEKELEELHLLINDFVNGIPKVKGQLTRKVSGLSKKYGAAEAKQVMKLLLSLAALENPGERIRTLLCKYMPSAPYIEKSDSGRSEYTMGWYSDTEQVHSVMLPLSIESCGHIVSFYGLSTQKDDYLKLFKAAEKIPYSQFEKGINVFRNISIVSIWINTRLYQYQINDCLQAAALYIAFFPLASVEDVYLQSKQTQISRIDADDDECACWYVHKNIKELGFWDAYRWWKKCHIWYKSNHPGWFDEELWHWGTEAGGDVGTMWDESLWLVL